MSEMQMPTPTAEHGMLAERVGKWNVDCTYFMDPSQDPMKCKAVESVEAVGGFWTLSKFESEFMGMPFVGRATMGYDANAGHFVGSWIDCMSSVMFTYTGAYNESSKTLEMKGRAFMPQFGGESDFRMTIDKLTVASHRFEMFATPPGSPEFKMFSYDYTRAD